MAAHVRIADLDTESSILSHRNVNLSLTLQYLRLTNQLAVTGTKCLPALACLDVMMVAKRADENHNSLHTEENTGG
jgi:hypothetical protein